MPSAPSGTLAAKRGKFSSSGRQADAHDWKPVKSTFSSKSTASVGCDQHTNSGAGPVALQHEAPGAAVTAGSSVNRQAQCNIPKDAGSTFEETHIWGGGDEQALQVLQLRQLTAGPQIGGRRRHHQAAG